MGSGGQARVGVSGAICWQVGRFRTHGVQATSSEELRVLLNLVFRRRRAQRRYFPSRRRSCPRRRWLLRPGRWPGRRYGSRRSGAKESGAICPKIGRPPISGRGRVSHPISGESDKLGRKFRRQLLWKTTRGSSEFPLAAGGRLGESSGRERRQELGHQADVCGADFSHISGRWAESTIRKSESPESGTSGETNREDLQPCGASLFAASCPFPGEIRTQRGTGISGFRLAIRGGDFVARSPRKLADIRFVCIIAIPPEPSPESGKSDPGVSATPRRLVRRLV